MTYNNMKIRNLLILFLAIAGFTIFGTPAVTAQGLSLKAALKPAVKQGGFTMAGYFLWCPSVIKDEHRLCVGG